MKAITLFLCFTMYFNNDINVEQEINHCVPVEDIKPQLKVVKTEKGVASWYGHENKIACDGKKIEHNIPALAHKTLPIGTTVKVTCTKTNKSVIAVVVDRGPYIKGRVADLNIPAAKQLNLINKGITTVILEILQPTIENVTS